VTYQSYKFVPGAL